MRQAREYGALQQQVTRTANGFLHKAAKSRLCTFVVQQTLRLLDSCRTNNGEVRDILTRTQSAISVVTKTLLDKVRPTA